MADKKFDLNKEIEFDKAKSLIYSLLTLNFQLDKKKILKQTDFTQMAIYTLESLARNLKLGIEVETEYQKLKNEGDNK